ncbi:hypothetical protein [Rossellomorea sp. BNER]|uniref:hypothetical protein n=1 Tax=Rossellomorea sp. BNER TaxID=2962031 RepID=UPI003AF25153|nr:hypothetical protein [Rossellomorea sp. BNER]
MGYGSKGHQIIQITGGGSSAYERQVDYVEEVKKNANFDKSTVWIEYGNPQRHFHVIQPISKDKGVKYTFTKNANDDYIIALDGSVGTIAKQEKTAETKNYESETGTINKLYPPSFYAETVGSTIYFEFVGTGFTFNHYADNRGGMWQFDIKTITDVAVGTVDISTFSTTVVSPKSTPVINGLVEGKYKVTATFTGDDPANLPSGGAGTSRGWVWHETREGYATKTLSILNKFDVLTETEDVLYSYSNKEFAINCRPFNSGYAFNWVPEHNAVGTAFKVVDQQLIINGELTSWFAVNNYIKNVDSMQLIQKVQGKSPEDGAALVEIITIHSLKDGVLSVTGKMNFLKQTEIDVGYSMMCPVYPSFSKKMKTSLGNVYGTVLSDGSHTNLSEGDEALSFVFLNDIDKKDYALAVTIDKPKETLRYQEEGRGTPFSWIEHRNTSLNKLYLQPFNNVVVDAGYTYSFSQKYVIGIVNGVSDLLL